MKIIVTIIVLALLVWGGYALFSNGESEVEVNTSGTNQEQSGNNTTPTQNTTPTPTPEVKEFTVVGRNFSLTPATMTVNRGDRVKITFQSQGTHDWVIDAFNARTNVLSAGQSQTIEFTANQSGSFEYYCSVGNHRQMGMTGTLVVQ